MLRAILLLPLIFGGTVGVVVFGYYSLVDWNALQQTYLNFEELAQNAANRPGQSKDPTEGDNAHPRDHSPSCNRTIAKIRNHARHNGVAERC